MHREAIKCPNKSLTCEKHRFTSFDISVGLSMVYAVSQLLFLFFFSTLEENIFGTNASLTYGPRSQR